MLDKLRAIAEKYNEIQAHMEDPSVYADMAVYTKLIKEQKEIEPLAAAYNDDMRAYNDAEDAKQLLADPDNLRYPEDTYVYLGIHDFEGDGTPELIFGDGVSLAVFTYAEGRVERIADLYFPGIIWCVNGIAIHGNGMSVMCAGSGGMDCVNFGYIDGGYVLGLYAPRAHMEPTINGEVCTVDDINRIHTTDYNEMAPEEFREKIQLLFENGQWVLKLPTGEASPVNDALDFSKFVW